MGKRILILIFIGMFIPGGSNFCQPVPSLMNSFQFSSGLEPPHKDKKYIRFFVGSGLHYTYVYNEFHLKPLFSFGVIPQFSKHFYLTGRVDCHEMDFHNITEVLLGTGPFYGHDFAGDKLHLFAGGVVTFHIMGDRGIDLSVIPSLGLEYQINENFAFGSEIRKPVFFWRDSGHNQLFLNFNLVFRFAED